MRWLDAMRESAKFNAGMKILDVGSKLYVSLTEEQKAMLLAQLSPEQLGMLLELKEEWDRFKKGSVS